MHMPPLFLVNNHDKPIVKPPAGNPGRPWWDIMLEQLANAVVVGLTAGLSAFVAAAITGTDMSIAWQAGLIAAGGTFCIEMRKYRRSKE